MLLLFTTEISFLSYCTCCSGSTIVGIGSPDPPQFIYDDEEYKDVFLSGQSSRTYVCLCGTSLNEKHVLEFCEEFPHQIQDLEAGGFQDVLFMF